MNIWLVMSGEPLEQFGERPHRVGILSKMLVEQGHNVTWFTTTYDHQHKKYFFNETTSFKNDFGVNMVFLHSDTPYSKNISFNRIKNHKEVGNEFARISRTMQKPDIILTAFPTIELSYETVKFGKDQDIPVVVDIRDMWPDIFLEIVPFFLKPIMKLFLFNYYQQTKYIFNNTFALSAMTDEFLKYGEKYRSLSSVIPKKSFPFGYPKFILDEDQELKSIKKFKDLGIDFDKFNIVYFGTIGKQFDFEPAIKIASKLDQHNINFIFCGKGDNFEDLKYRTQNITNIIWTGWVEQGDIWTLMKYSQVGFAPYINKKDFLASIPNKVIEYLAGGLPILSSIDGELGRIIKDNNCGFVYNDSDELYKIILNLKNNNNLQNKMSQNSLEVFNEKFSSEKVYGEMILYLESIVEKYKENER